jgi:hypothetical protein
MHENAMKCNKTQSKWCINKHRTSKIIDTFETYQGDLRCLFTSPPQQHLANVSIALRSTNTPQDRRLPSSSLRDKKGKFQTSKFIMDKATHRRQQLSHLQAIGTTPPPPSTPMPPGGIHVPTTEVTSRCHTLGLPIAPRRTTWLCRHHGCKPVPPPSTPVHPGRCYRVALLRLLGLHLSLLHAWPPCLHLPPLEWRLLCAKETLWLPGSTTNASGCGDQYSSERGLWWLGLEVINKFFKNLWN